MKYFNECDVVFNSRFGSGLVLAQNASITVNRNINSTYTIGRQNSSQMFKTKADETNVEFTYFPNISDPIYKCFDYIKTGIFTNSFPETNIPVQVALAGVSGSFYPSRYSLTVNPNSKIQASVSLSSFSNLSGSLNNKTAINNLASGSGIAHSWNAKVSGTAALYNVLDFAYGISINWNPIYSVGQQRPRQVDLSAGEETFDFTIENFNSNFSNTDLSTAENAKINITTFGNQSIMIINTSGSKIDSSNMSINLDDFAKNKISLKRSF